MISDNVQDDEDSLIVNTYSRAYAICSEIVVKPKRSKKDKKKDKKKKKKRNRSPVVKFAISRSLTPTFRNIKNIARESIA